MQIAFLWSQRTMNNFHGCTSHTELSTPNFFTFFFGIYFEFHENAFDNTGCSTI